MPALQVSRRIASAEPRATLALFPSLGTAARMWEPLLNALPGVAQLDVLLFDLPGHGDAGVAGEFDLRALAADAITVLTAEVRCPPVVVAGVSMGGAIAVEVAKLRPEHIAAFASFNSAERFGSAASWDSLIVSVQRAGTAAFDPEGTRVGWFSRAFAEGDGASLVAHAVEDLAAVDVGSYIACCRALAAYDGTPGVATMTVPGLAVGGADDRATPASGMRALAARNDGIRYAELPGAHLGVIEHAPDAAALLGNVLQRVLADTGNDVR